MKRPDFTRWQPAQVLFFVSALALLTIAPAASLDAQDLEEKRRLEHEDYARWNSVRGANLSNDGNWVSYTLTPGDGDATLMIRQIQSGKMYSIVRGTGARFSFDNRFAVFTVSPDPKQIEKLTREKKPRSQFPKPKLEILDLKTGKHVTIRDVRSFSMPARAAGWVAFKMLEGEEEKSVKQEKSSLTTTYEITPEGVRRQQESKGKSRKKSPSGKPAAEKQKPAAGEKKTKTGESKPAEEKKGGKKAKEKKKNNGTTLVLRNLDTHIEQRFPYVVNFRFSEDGKSLAFTASAPEGDTDGVYVVDLEKPETRQIISGKGNYGQAVFSKDGKQVAFLTNRDDYESEKPLWSMYHWSTGRKEAKPIAASDARGIPDGWMIASSSAPLFSENGKRILFNTKPKPAAEPETKEGEEKKKVAKLDIWHWQDPFLQPQQLLQAERERNRSYRALYDISGRKVIQIATKEIPQVFVDPRSESNVVIGVSPDKYNKMRSWDVQGFSDWHLINLKTGDSRLLQEMARGNPSISPAGKYMTWWDGEKQTWFALPTDSPDSETGSEEPVDLGRGLGHPLHNELHDTPSLPGPYGSAGWLADDAGLLIYDRWDIWRVDPSGKDDPVCITGGRGREDQIRFRYVRLDPEQRTVDLAESQVLSALVHKTRASGYYHLLPAADSDETGLKELIELDENVSGLRKAKDADTVIFTRSTFTRSPDLWASTLEFDTLRRISRMNPQQAEYTWGSAELVRWKAADGQELDGLLYKPENFDAAKKYPLMVYFYERNSDNLHRYYNPEAGRSIINFSFYVSRGYVIFIPDIPYKTGEPGPSAANAVLPGVKNLVDQGYIDEARIGMQGHSWGGYQTAWLVTVTDMFACAESGAPVSNMTSAYGGIRWGTGMSRMFQYEKTQSRIGGTLWEARDRYIANSPVFFADRVNTPLLILHNDRDTAVPWYQGIELFVALRRLEKPAWMLNYNGDPHWVMSDENRMDFAKRMQQFFDHYLLGDPMPVWMASGVPAVDKGKKFGFEYVEEKTVQEKAGEEEEATAETSSDN